MTTKMYHKMMAKIKHNYGRYYYGYLLPAEMLYLVEHKLISPTVWAGGANYNRDVLDAETNMRCGLCKSRYYFFTLSKKLEKYLEERGLICTATSQSK